MTIDDLRQYILAKAGKPSLDAKQFHADFPHLKVVYSENERPWVNV